MQQQNLNQQRDHEALHVTTSTTKDLQTTSKCKRVYGDLHNEELTMLHEPHDNMMDQNRDDETNDMQDGPPIGKGENIPQSNRVNTIKSMTANSQAASLHDSRLASVKHTKPSQAPAKNLSGNNKAGTGQAGHTSLKVGSRVVLKSWRNKKKNVSLATIISCDPREKVGGAPLGKECWMVRLSLRIMIDEPLIRPYDKYEVIGDIGDNPIAWPSSCIERAPT